MRKLPVLITALALGAAPATAVGAPPPSERGLAPTADRQWTPKPDQWIVQLDAAPLAGYQGGVQGLRATAPETTGHKVDADGAAARAYDRYLDERQTRALRATPGVDAARA